MSQDPSQTSDSTQESDDEPRKVAAVIYGIKNRDSAARLIDACAVIPDCFPQVIFRIGPDKKYFGVVPYGYGGKRLYYVRVDHWYRRDSGRPPLIAYTLRPQTWNRRLRSQARQSFKDYESSVRSKPTLLYYDGKRHAELRAITTAVAS